MDFARRMHIPFRFLNDSDLRLADPPQRLPTFGVGGMTLYRRLTLVADAAADIVRRSDEFLRSLLDRLEAPGRFHQDTRRQSSQEPGESANQLQSGDQAGERVYWTAASGRAILFRPSARLESLEGLFHTLVDRLPAVELHRNVRQEQPWERTALAELRNGLVADAVASYRKHRRLVIGRSRDETLVRAVDLPSSEAAPAGSGRTSL